MDHAKRTTHDEWSSIVLTVVVFVLVAELPAFCVYDVLTHDRVALGFTRQTSWLIEFMHSAYTFTAIVALWLLGLEVVRTFFPRSRTPARSASTTKTVMMGTLWTSLLGLYVLPLFWLLHAVPGYWRVLLDAVGFFI